MDELSCTRKNLELEALEIKLLLEAVFEWYGFDFRDYAYASLRRRVWQAVTDEGLKTISSLQERLLHEPACLDRFLQCMTVTVTSMFRDPHFYLALREKIIPILRTYPFFRIWHVGCSTGEEVYSMAILLSEEGLYEKSRIYATDINESVLRRARKGQYSLRSMQRYTHNYLCSGGKGAFSDYYIAKHNSAVFSRSLKKNIVFAHHNLVTDGSFNEFQLICCRNVLIYFNQTLQRKVFRLLTESLDLRGFLALGNKESIRFSQQEDLYQEFDCVQKIYRRLA